MSKRADFTPGDAPVPVGSTVEYFGSQTPGRYRVIEHHDPASHPYNPPNPETAAELYPDGVAYDLWPANLPRKFGFRDYAVYYARRTSFTVVSPPADVDVQRGPWGVLSLRAPESSERLEGSLVSASWMSPQAGCPCGGPLEDSKASECSACQRLRTEIMTGPPQVFYGTPIHALRDEVLAETGQTACRRCLHPTGGMGLLCRYCAEGDG